jgi:hypothetical protein
MAKAVLSASVGRIPLKNASSVGVSNLLGVFSSANWRRCGDNPNKFGTPTPCGETFSD